jgi:hypothetical protein
MIAAREFASKYPLRLARGIARTGYIGNGLNLFSYF